MHKRNAYLVVAGWVAVASAVVSIPGCGSGGPQSEEDFLSEVRGESVSGAGAVADGTVPPVTESMDNVAKVRLETTDLHLGTVPNGELTHRKLMVYNDGKMDLKITKVDTTCACTMGYINPDTAVVGPGKESWIDVVFDPNRVNGFKSHKVLTITTTDPAQAQILVDVRADIEPEFSVSVEDLDFGEVKKGERTEKRVRYRQVQEAPANLLSAEILGVGPRAARVPGFDVSVEKIPEDQWQTPGKSEFDLIIATNGDLPSGAFDRYVTLNTDTKRMPQYHMKVLGTNLAPYTIAPIYPARAALLPDQATKTMATSATFTSTGTISIAPGTPTNPAISATVQPGPAPGEIALDIRVAPEGIVPHKGFDEILPVQVTVDGVTFNEIVGVQFAGAGGEEHSEGDGHQH